MANEIYNVSWWGSPTRNGWGNIYYLFALLSPLGDRFSDRVLADGGTVESLNCVKNADFNTANWTYYFRVVDDKAQKVYSVLPTNGDGDFTFARSGTATRVNQSGLIETVGNNVPRLEYSDGGCPSLLLEPERLNLQTRSEEFDNSVWSVVRSSITPNDAISPSGLLNADKLVGTSGSSSYIFDSITVTNESIYTISVFAKYIDKEQFLINVFTQPGFADFNILNGTVTSNSGTVTEPKIENYGNGWYRVSAKFTATADGGVNYGFFLNNATNKSVHIWGAQFELGDFASSYIPTTTAIATRSAETANGAGEASTFNDSQGVLYAEVKGFEEIPSLNGYIEISSPSVSFTNAAVLQFRNNGDLRFYFDGISGENIQFIDATIDFTENNKIAVQYDSNGSNYKMFVNGVSIPRYGPSTNQSVNGLSQLNLNYGSANSFIGEVKDVRVYNNALTDAELQALTQ